MTVLKAIELYILKGWIVQYVNSSSIKLLCKSGEEAGGELDAQWKRLWVSDRIVRNGLTLGS